MTARSLVTHGFFSLSALALGVLGARVTGVRILYSYGSGILIMIYVCALGGAALLTILFRTRDFVPLAIGFVGGLAVGIALGIMLGRVAIHNNWVYWTLVLLVAGVIAWLKPII